MNQPRLTCLTTLLLATVIAPIATVHSKTLPSPAVNSPDGYIPLSPLSLPTITPLTVTELETDVVIPVAIHPVPQVSKLPIVTPLSARTKTHSRNKQHYTTSIVSLPTKKLYAQSIGSKLPSIKPVFNPTAQVTTPIFAIPNPVDSSIFPVNSVVPLPSRVTNQVAKPQAFRSFTSQAVSEPILVVRKDNAQPANGETPPTKVITNSATVQAEIADLPPATTIQPPTLISTASARPEITSPPQIAPIGGNANDAHSERLLQRSDLPSFESGVPVFVVEKEQPQQIVTTAIAQIGDTIVAPEPSIAIPVERPKQLTIPNQPPVQVVPAVPPLAQPLGTGIVKIEQPSKTVQPALDKIVATQTGQASWYGSEGGPQTANGERYNPSGLTAAHRTLPFGTKVRVTSLKTGKTVTVRINDRGPFHSRRIIDVSAGAAEVIGIKNDGIGNVRMEVLGTQG
jgi:rare lipoprotein A